MILITIKNSMKRLFIYSMLVASSLGAMTSCSDFLDVKPVGAVSEEELLNQEGVNYAITGMYSSMLTGVFCGSFDKLCLWRCTG